jgi:hypothetical protein
MLAGCGLDERTDRADKPVSREVATKEIPGFPFPSSATDVYYVIYSGGMQDFDEYVRFTVDPKDLDSSVRDILAYHDKNFQETNSYPSLSITAAPSSAAPSSAVPPYLSPIPWWCPNSITSGYYRGSMAGRPIYIWVDVSHHRIFVCETD